MVVVEVAQKHRFNDSKTLLSRLLAETIEASEAEQLLISETVEPVASKKSRMAELDNTNANYERLLRARNSEATNIDHVSANIVCSVWCIIVF